MAGPWSCAFPPGLRVTRVTTARDMHAAASDLWPSMDIACCTAAVCDFRPLPPSCGAERKLKKRDLPGQPSMELEANPDILRGLGRSKGDHQTLIGFAAETGDLLPQARLKLAEKRLDLMVANQVNIPGSGFDSPTNAVLLLDRNGRVEHWPQLPKTEVAWRICDHLQHL